MVPDVLFNKKLCLLFFRGIDIFKKLQLIQLKENDSKTFPQQNFHCFTGKECPRFLRSRFC